MLDPHGREEASGAAPSGAIPSGAAPSRPAAAIVLAAGDGTRMRSAVPKVLHPIAGRSLLGHAVHAVAALDPEHLVVVVGTPVDEHLNPNPGHVLRAMELMIDHLRKRQASS